MKIVNTSLELMKICGNWTTVHIRNDYIFGAKSFVIQYGDKKVKFENDDILEVGRTACQYNATNRHECERLLFDLLLKSKL